MNVPAISVAGFLIACAFILYVLVGYPVVLALLSRRQSRAIRRHPHLRTVSIVLPVHNGERWIEHKLNSIAALDYPHNLIQLIVVDDGSSDRTSELARRFDAMPLKLLSRPRGGKARALNAGISSATGEILLLTDVRQALEPASLKNLLECFADDSVGVASGELVILTGESQQEADIGLYWRYEKWIRTHLSNLDSILGATGSFYALRRDLAITIPPRTLLDDMYLPLAAFFKGYRVILDTRAKAFDYPTGLATEFRRKVRTQAGVYQIIFQYPRLLLPTTRMWFHFGSHKLSRLVLPYALLLLAASSLRLPPPWMETALAGQAAFYGLSVCDPIVPEHSSIKRASSMARTFTVLMAAAFCAPFYLMFNSGTGGWSTTQTVGDGVSAPPR